MYMLKIYEKYINNKYQQFNESNELNKWSQAKLGAQ
jgi:hypothetical protein